MAITRHPFNVASTASGSLNRDKLNIEISTHPDLSSNFLYVTREGFDIFVVYSDPAYSGPQLAALTGTINAHNGSDVTTQDKGEEVVFKSTTTTLQSTNVQSAIEEVYNIASGSISIKHKKVYDLIHFIDDGPADGFASGAFKETHDSFFPTGSIWWTSAAKTDKLVEKIITRSGGGATNLKPTPIIWRMYDTDGSTVIATVSDAITYQGLREVGRTRTITL